MQVYEIDGVVVMDRNPAVGRILYELRHTQRQQDRYMFTKNLWLLGILMAGEMSSELASEKKKVDSVLGEAEHTVVHAPPVLVNVMRASNAMVQGNMEVFRDADISVIAASRNEETLECEVHYLAMSYISGRDVIVIDPMLATGGTLVHVCELVKQYQPQKILVQSAFAAPEGLERMAQAHPDIKIYAAVVDEKLNDVGYIVPGLGDAGDLQFGEKMVSR